MRIYVIPSVVCAMRGSNLTKFYEILDWGSKLMNVMRRILFRFVSVLDTQICRNLAYHTKTYENFNDN